MVFWKEEGGGGSATRPPPLKPRVGGEGRRRPADSKRPAALVHHLCEAGRVVSARL